MMQANRSQVTVEDLVRNQHPKSYEKWDGTELQVAISENRSKPEVVKKCTVSLVNKDAVLYATFKVDPETDVVEIIWRAK